MLSPSNLALWINCVPEISSRGFIRLVRAYPDFVKVLDASASELCRQARLTPRQSEAIRKILNMPEALQREKEQMVCAGVKAVTWFDANYPPRLREIADPPAVLSFKGDAKCLRSPSIAIVGTRGASAYGLRWAEKLAYDLSLAGLTIISGLAKGIDAAAHRGALRARRETVGVVGHGLAEIYPPEHHQLYQRVADAGAVVSEFPFARQPRRETFPQRNRLISALAYGVIVVEAAQRSGALITADFALEQSREVFALPGPVDSLGQVGPHRLIQQGAHLIQSAEDVLSVLSFNKSAGEPIDSNSPRQTDLEEPLQRVFDSLRGDEAKYVDVIAEECELSASDSAVALMQLQLRGLIQQLPGKRFIKTN